MMSVFDGVFVGLLVVMFRLFRLVEVVYSCLLICWNWVIWCVGLLLSDMLRYNLLVCVVVLDMVVGGIGCVYVVSVCSVSINVSVSGVVVGWVGLVCCMG